MDDNKEQYRIIGDGHGKYFLMYRLDGMDRLGFYERWHFFSGASGQGRHIFNSIEEAEEYLKEPSKDQTEIVKRFDSDGNEI